MSGTSKKWTYDDLLLLPEDGLRHELIDGNHYVNGSPVTRPQVVLYLIVIAISKYLEEHQLVHLYLAPLRIVPSQENVSEPDMWREIMTVNNDHVAPELLIEVLPLPDEEHYDFPNSAREYWIIDPGRNVARIFLRKTAGGYERAAELSGSDTLTSPLFPTLEIRLDQIFAN
jgi:Uma2 family endonuclease